MKTTLIIFEFLIILILSFHLGKIKQEKDLCKKESLILAQKNDLLVELRKNKAEPETCAEWWFGGNVDLLKAKKRLCKIG